MMKQKLIKMLYFGLIIALLSIFPLVFVNISVHTPNNGIIITRDVPRSQDLTPPRNINYTWGYIGNDQGNGITIDSSNNVYVVGETNSTGTYGLNSGDVFLVKYNSVGEQLWNITWGGSGANIGLGIALDSNGNIYITGNTNSFGAGSFDAFLVKFNNLGLQQWNVTWGGPGYDVARAIAINSANDIYIAGLTNSFGAGGYDAFVAEYNDNGAQLWNTTWGDQYDEKAYGIAIDSNNNVYISGCTDSFGTGIGYNNESFLVKYDSSGIQQWNSTWGGNGNQGSRGMAIDSSGNIYITTESNCFSADFEALLVKFNSTGAEQWYRLFIGPDGGIGYGVTVDSMNDIYMVGGTLNATGNENAFVAEYDDSGLQLWNTTWGGANDDFALQIAVNSLNCIYIVGITSSYGAGGTDSFLLIYYNSPKLTQLTPNPNPDGSILLNWTPLIDSNFYNIYRSNSVITNISDLTPIATVSSTSYNDKGLNDGYYYYEVVAIDSIGGVVTSNCLSVTVSLLSSPILAQISPNPTNSSNIYLNWNSVQGASSYNIYKSNHNIINTMGLAPIATTISTEFTDMNLTPGIYYYAITAVNPTVESDLSNIQSVTIINSANSNSTNNNSTNSNSTVPKYPLQNIPGFPTNMLILFSVFTIGIIILRKTKNETLKF